MKQAFHANPAVPLSVLLDGLERLLRTQLESHQRLLRCIEGKRQAIRTADMNGITDLCKQEHTILQRITELEKHRLELIGRLTETLRPNAEALLTISEIAALSGIEESSQVRLTVLAAQLREALNDVKRQSSVVRAASEALSRHMTGIVQTVHSALSRARVYGQRGTIALGTQIHSVVDLKS